MEDTLIEMKNIKKTYDGKKYVLDDLSFSAHKGELVVIKGLSGSGKSTLLNTIGLLDNFDSGYYKLNNYIINPQKYNKYANIRATDIGFIFQAYHLIDSISIKDNILLPFIYSSMPINSRIIKHMDSILEEFNLLDAKEKKVSLLSGGEKQRVAIARAIIKSPSIVIADEPTGNLDDNNSNIVMRHLCNLKDKGTTVILVTHDTRLLKYSDKTYLLQDGRLI